MLLVLIALACATIMATAYLASRDNSAPIGENAVGAAEARWASLSALELAVAIMETESVWRTAHAEGKLLDDFPIGAASIDVDVIDLMTELPPTASTEMVQITATASVGSMTQHSKATAIITPGAGGRIDVGLAEFSLFSGSSIQLNDTALVARWNDAPTTKLGRRIAIGANGQRAGAIDVRDGAEIVDGTMYLHAASSSSAYRSWADQGAQIDGVPDGIPMPAAPTPPAPSGRAVLTYTVTVDTLLANSAQVNDLNVVTAAGVLRLGDGVTLSVLNNLVMMVDGVIVVAGDATLVVGGDATISDSTIILEDGASLTLYVGGDLTMERSYIGDASLEEDGLDVTGAATYADVSNLMLYTVPGAGGTWTIDDGSVVKAELYAPGSAVVVSAESAVYGRIAADSITLSGGSALYADHGLGGAFGYTNAESPLWDGSSVASAVESMTCLDEDELRAVADALSVEVGMGAMLISPSSVVVVSTGDGGSITPRVVSVEYDVTAVGKTMSDSETTAVTGARIKSGAVESKTQTAIAADLDSFATKMRALDVSMFVSIGGRTSAQVQEIMASSLETAATKVREGDASMALFKLRSVLSRFDGDSSAPDVMESCTTKKRIYNAINEQIEVIMKYVSVDDDG